MKRTYKNEKDRWCIRQSASEISCEWFNKKYRILSFTGGGYIYLVNYANKDDSPYEEAQHTNLVVNYFLFLP